MRPILVVLSLVLSVHVQAQVPRSFHALRDSLCYLPFVFEGYITSSELYIADKQGREIDNPDVQWNDSIGLIRGFDTTCFAFVRAGIFVLEQHKGRLSNDKPIHVLSKIGNFKHIWYQVKPGGDTLLTYAMQPGTRRIDEFQLLVTKKEFSRRRLFFCKRWERIEPYKYREAENYSNLQTLLQIPLDTQTSQFSLDPNGHNLLYPLPFYRVSRLEDLLLDL